MAQSDWTEGTGNASSSDVARGVTSGIARPNGGGSFIYGFNSKVVVDGAAILFTNQVNFAPMAKGGSVRGAIKRGPSGGPTGFAPFLFIGLQGANIADLGYLLGLCDADPHRIVLRKGRPSEGIPNVAPGTDGVLRRSTATFALDTWLHLRLDMIVNLNGDVILKVFANDLAANPVSAPVWAAVAGCEDFTDDALGVNSGSAPFLSGRGGFGFQVEDVARRGYFDHIEVHRQT